MTSQLNPSEFSSSHSTLKQSRSLQWLSCLGILSLAIFSWLPDSYFKMVGWPWILVWQTSFLLFSVLGIIQLRSFSKPFRRLSYGIDWALIALSASLIISGIFSPFPILALQNIIFFFCYVLLLYSVINMTLPLAAHRLLWRYLVVVGGVAACISVALWQPNADMWLSNDFQDALSNRFPLGHHNFSGGYFVLVLPLMVAMAKTQRGFLRWVSGIASIVVAVALYSTGSRGAMLGAIAMASVTIIYLFIKSRGRQRRNVLILGGVIGITILLLLLGNPRIRNMFNAEQLVPEVESAQQITLADGPTKDRYFMIQAAGNMLRHKPFLGVGPGNMVRVYNLYRPIETGMGLELVQQLHSLPIHLLGEIGLLGFGSYLALTVCVITLWYSTSRLALSSQDQALLSAVGISFIGYGVSSLTDYQLENIPIALTLTLLLSILSTLNSSYTRELAEPALPLKLRRWLSLSVLGFIGIAILLWSRQNLSIYLSASGMRYIEQADFVTADTQFSKAIKIAYWDPTPSMLAIQELSTAQFEAASRENRDAIQTLVLRYYQSALATIPYDTWLNNNLAVELFPLNQELSEQFIRRSIQLLPRQDGYRYHLLGLNYLAQQQIKEAVVAFALETLIYPQYITLDFWDEPAFDQIKPLFFEKVIDLYDRFLSELPETSLYYNLVYEQTQLMHWWTGSALESSDQSRLRPITQAVLLSNSEPATAVRLMTDCLKIEPNNNACNLLRAWLKPEQYLKNYLDNTELNDKDSTKAIEHINKFRDVRAWIKSLSSPANDQHIRRLLALGYRNESANQISFIARPAGLQWSTLAAGLQLFEKMPRDLPLLDHIIDDIRTEQLLLPHSTANHFKITAIPKVDLLSLTSQTD